MKRLVDTLPQQRRTYRFAVTPLADAIFQLLIFFMLTSNLTPYSLLTLKSANETPAAGAATVGAGEAGTTTQQPNQGDMSVWTIEAGAVLTAGERFEFDNLGTLAQALANKSQSPSVHLIVRPSAHVQDVATVLAQLKTAGIKQIKISGSG